MPPRNVLPKPYSKPHPPIWMAAGSPSTFDLAAELGVGVLCFGFSTPGPAHPARGRYKEKIEDCKNPVGGFVNNNVMITTQMICMEDGAKARKTFLEADSNYHLSLVFRYLDTFPKPPGIPEWPEIIPAMDAEHARRGHRRGRHRRRRPRRGGQGDRELRRDRRRPARLRHAVDLHADRVVPGGRRDLRQARAAGLRQGPGAPHDEAASGRRRLLSTRPRSRRSRHRRGRYSRNSPASSRRSISSATSAGPRCARVDPVALLDAVALELRPQVVDHRGVGQRTGVLRFDPAVLHPLLDDADRGAQHGVVERDAVRRAGRREQVEHERVEDALGDGEVAARGEGGHRLGRGARARPGSGCAPPPATARSHPAAAWRRTSRGRGRPTARGGRPPAAPRWSCRSRGSRSGGEAARAGHHALQSSSPARAIASARPGRSWPTRYSVKRLDPHPGQWPSASGTATSIGSVHQVTPRGWPPTVHEEWSMPSKCRGFRRPSRSSRLSPHASTSAFAPVAVLAHPVVRPTALATAQPYSSERHRDVMRR